MADTLTFELVSPEKLLFSKPVTMVTVPGSGGEYGVLSGHSPMMTKIKPGVIRVYEENDSTVSARLFVAGGFAEVTQSRFTVLVQEALPVSDLDAAELNRQAKDIAAKISAAPESDLPALEAEQELIQAKIQAITSQA